MLKHVKARSYYLSKYKLKMALYICLCIAIIIACVAIPIKIWVSSDIVGRGITSIRGDSMTPTIHNNDILYVQPTKFERGEIVVAKCPSSEKYSATTDIALLKRIVGLPGEIVEITADGILINGVLLEEEYTTTQNKTLSTDNDFEEVILSDNEYFLLGDNRENSFDSRHVGAVHGTAFLYGLTIEPNEYTYSLIFKWIAIASFIILGYSISVIGLLFAFTYDYKSETKKKVDVQKKNKNKVPKLDALSDINGNAVGILNDKTSKPQPKSEKNKKKAERAERSRAEQISKNYTNKPKHRRKK